jgi:hypothetical protein
MRHFLRRSVLAVALMFDYTAVALWAVSGVSATLFVLANPWRTARADFFGNCSGCSTSFAIYYNWPCGTGPFTFHSGKTCARSTCFRWHGVGVCKNVLY